MNLEKLSPKSWFKREHGEHHPLLSQDSSVDTPVSHLHHEIDRIFGTMWRGFGSSSETDSGAMKETEVMLKPNLDIKESDKYYQVCLEIPGVQEGDIKIEVQGDILAISGEKRQEKEEEAENFHRIERSYGAFRRMLTLPEDVNVEQIDATFKDGVLSVTVAKNPQAKVEGRKIEINKQIH